MKKTLIFVLMFILMLIPFVSADFNYSKLGGDAGNYVTSTGDFSSGLYTPEYSNPISIGGSVIYPLADDLDNDGTSEIVVWDDGDIEIYDLSTFPALNSLYGLSTGLNEPENVQIFDIDGDDKREYLLFEASSEKLYGYEYNGTHLFKDIEYALATSGNGASAEYMFVCGATDECILMFTLTDTGVASADTKVYAQAFNSTAKMGGEIVLATKTNVATATWECVHCLPDERTLQYGDFDNDGTYEYLGSYGLFCEDGSTESVYMSLLSYNGSQAVQEKSASQTGLNLLGDTGTNPQCDVHHFAKWFTNALAVDVHKGGFTYEYVIGASLDTSNFGIFHYDSLMSYDDRHPSTLEGNGVIISNIFAANVFHDGDERRDDFCVFGQDNISEKINLVCGSEQNSYSGYETGFFPSETLILTLNDYNSEWGLNQIIPSYKYIPNLVHAGQFADYIHDSTNKDEIITSFGIFRIFLGVLSDELFFEYQQSKDNSIVIPVDVTEKNSVDLMVQRTNNFWYLSDGFINRKPYQINGTLRPCIKTRTVKTNDTLEFSGFILDSNDDDVKLEMILYEGETGEVFTNTTDYVESGQEFTISLTMNASATNTKLVIRASDDQDPTNYLSETSHVSIAPSGVSYADNCIDFVNIEDSEQTILISGGNESNLPSDLTEEDKSAVRDVFTGKGIVDTVWLPLIAIVIMFVTFGFLAVRLSENPRMDSKTVLVISGFAVLFEWLFFVFYDILAGWTILVFIMFGAVFIGYKSYTTLKGQGGV